MNHCLRGLTLVALLAGAYPAAHGAAPRRPNILFIITDQQPCSTLGAYGNRQIKTPHVDRLAREGMRFNQFHITAFACSPSRACYWTGQWSHHHGILTNDIVLDARIPTLGSLTRAAGYQAAFVGKWHLGGEMYVMDDDDRWSFRRVDDAQDFVFDKSGPWRGGEDQPQCGFLDKWVGGWAQYRTYLRSVGLGDLVAGRQRTGNHNMAPSGPEGTHIYSRIPAAHHEAAFLAGEAEKFLRSERDRSKPFCLVLSIYGPHLPVAPPQPWDTMYDPQSVPLPENFRDDLAGKPWSQRNDFRCWRAGAWSPAQYRDYIARYWGYCSYIDAQVGRVLRALDDTGVADDTIVIYTTDHGDMIGAHGFVFKLGSGYDELMRVPFLVRYPRAIRPGTSNAALVQSIDVLPTLLDLCGLPPSPSIDGRSFRKLLEGRVQEFRDQVVTVMMNTIMLATPVWKLVYSQQRDAPAFVELYDRHEQPLEVNNRAGDPACAPTLATMRGRLVTWLRESGYPYAKVIEERLATARTRLPATSEMTRPRVAACQPIADKQGRTQAAFTIEWQVGEALAPRPEENTTKYWTFVQVLGPGMRVIVTRATQWPEPPTTTWQVGTKHVVGPLRVPILPHMQGGYPVRVGLYAPDSKSRPAVFGEAQRIVGTLTVERSADGGCTLNFKAVE